MKSMCKHLSIKLSSFLKLTHVFVINFMNFIEGNEAKLMWKCVDWVRILGIFDGFVGDNGRKISNFWKLTNSFQNDNKFFKITSKIYHFWHYFILSSKIIPKFHRTILITTLASTTSKNLLKPSQKIPKIHFYVPQKYQKAHFPPIDSTHV